jgi:UDP-N-acetylglucosamine/UDP-N-acetylgalactosamine diphosphorylase
MLDEQLRKKLVQYDQQHLIDFFERLNEGQRERLEEQLRSIDLEQLRRLHAGHDNSPDWGQLAGRAEPPPAISLQQNVGERQSQAKERGEALLRAGKVGVILVAGGQGTRLGFDLPKGMYRIGPLSSRTLFEMHVDRLRAVMKRYHVSIPLYVMTSPATDAQTRLFFSENDSFGLGSDQLRIFCQGTMPAVDASSGKVLLHEAGEIALSPDGHGGMLSALAAHGCLEDAADRGIEHFFYAQVDNPLVEICDPVLLGHHGLSGSEMTTQVVRKQTPGERVGNVVSIDGRVQIIEYSDLPEAVANQRAPDGELKLWAGNIAVHVFKRRFLERVQQTASGLPFHRARKAVPYIDAAGNRVIPTSPNAIKYERFIFDLLPLAQHPLVIEADAAQVFAPLKNADGASSDTPTTTRQAISRLHRQWLEHAGVEVAPAAVIEIHPNWALDCGEVAAKLKPGLEVVVDTYFA